jgi:hypothetical protein
MPRLRRARAREACPSLSTPAGTTRSQPAGKPRSCRTGRKGGGASVAAGRYYRETALRRCRGSFDQPAGQREGRPPGRAGRGAECALQV